MYCLQCGQSLLRNGLCILHNVFLQIWSFLPLLELPMLEHILPASQDIFAQKKKKKKGPLLAAYIRAVMAATRLQGISPIQSIAVVSNPSPTQLNQMNDSFQGLCKT